MENLVDYKVYQAPAEVKYVFMDYDMAKGDVKLSDYNLVAEGEEYRYDDIYVVLENIYREGNIGDLKSKYAIKPMRSISMSDIIEIDNRYYYVGTFGFKDITNDLKVGE